MNRFDIMDRTDRLLFNFLLGLVLPLLGFEVAIWLTFITSSADKTIITAALAGFSLGLLISLLIMFLLKPDVYRLPVPVLIFIYLFYNIFIFGFFMGVPVFNLVAGALAGYYWVKRGLNRNEQDDSGRDVRRLSIFTSSITAGVCLASAIVALLSKSTPEDLKGMFHLQFDITMPLLMGIIIIGGIMLVALQYYLTRFVMVKTLKASAPKS